MSLNVTQKLIQAHLIKGTLLPGNPIQIKIDQTLTQDATGTLVMLEFEALGLDRVHTEVSVQYVDHNILQTDYKNADDHLFLHSACKKYGVWFSRPGNGVSHPIHMERFGIPGKTLLGSDSHTCAAGALGMLAIGAGGIQVALAMAGMPYSLNMPKVLGVKLSGHLPEWVSAKDLILEMLRRHSVKGGVGKIIEYYGPGLQQLSALDRHVIANMGQELGATTSVFPADNRVAEFLTQQSRDNVFTELLADEDATYDENDEIDLSALEPLIALPSSPDKVVAVREVAGKAIYQSYIGSSANPGLRDFFIAADMVRGRKIDDAVSFDINPTSRQLLANLSASGALLNLLNAGARLHQTGCNGCIGMGQAPASGRISLRTVPRNFPGRSGTDDDQVYLCSPETATASALTGHIIDPRDFARDVEMPYPIFQEPDELILMTDMLEAPPADGRLIPLEKGPNIKPLPELAALPLSIKGSIILKVGDNISTDEILPAGAEVLPLRSNIPAISRFTFKHIDPDFYQRALAKKNPHSFIVGGENYGQGSSREHAALAPAFLGIACIIAKGFARIHRRNLLNFGILPLLFRDKADYEILQDEQNLSIENVKEQLISNSAKTILLNITLADCEQREMQLQHDLSDQEIATLIAGGLINEVRLQLH